MSSHSQFRPAFPRQKSPSRGRQAVAARAAGSQSLQRVTAKAGSGGSKLQREFRRVLQKVDRLKQRVQRWKEARPDIDTEISRYAAATERLRGLGREMIGLLDRSYSDAAFSKVEICQSAWQAPAELRLLVRNRVDEALRVVAVIGRYGPARAGCVVWPCDSTSVARARGG
jgi:hypothetical protein